MRSLVALCVLGPFALACAVPDIAFGAACERDGNCAPGFSCVDELCAPARDEAEGEGEGDPGEGEGEGEGEAGEGEGEAGEGEGEGEAPEFIVNETNDAPDAVLDGVCSADTDGGCTLRAAVTEAASLGNGAIVTFAPGVQPQLTSELRIDGTLVIAGDGVEITGAGDHRLLRISAPIVSLRDLTLSGGVAAEGGAIFVDEGTTLQMSGVTFRDNEAAGQGGALAVKGELTCLRCTFDGNEAATGGAIAVSGVGADAVLTILESRFEGNVADNGGALFFDVPLGAIVVGRSLFVANTAAENGGAIDLACAAAGVLVVENSTFTLNSAPNGGGAVNQCADSGVALEFCTFVDNDPDAFNPAAISTVELRGNMIGGGVGQCAGVGAITSLGRNLLEAADCSDNGAGIDLVVASLDLDLPPLNNGGPTLTFAIDADHPARNLVTAEVPQSCPATDQRGFTRPSGEACDAGAYDFDAFIGP